MPRISDLTRVNEVSDGDVFPIEQASSGRTRSVAFKTIRDEISADVDAAVSVAVAAAAAADEAAASADAQILREELADGATALKGADLVAYDAGETVREAIAASKQFDADLSNTSDPALGAAIVGRGVVAVESVAALEATPTTSARSDLKYVVGSDVYLFSSLDWSAEVSQDSDQITFVAPSFDATGAGGAFIREERAMPLITVRNFSRNNLALGVGESSSVGTAWDYTHLDGVGFVSSNVDRNHGWLTIADTFQWLDVETPFGVIIGDSIAEGHGSPDRHGRLHTGTTPIYDLALANVVGQPSYHLAEKTGMYWYNHGIGGQTSSQVWARWRRDVLAEDFDAGDGRPSVTLSRQPYAVWVNVGINDISTGVPPWVTKVNLINMAKSAKDNGIIIGFNTCGPHLSHTADQIAQQKELQRFILQELPKYGAYVFDFRTWFSDPANPDLPNPDLRADSVHPNGAGYLSYVTELVKQSAAPIVVQQLCVESKVDPDSVPSNLVDAKEVRALHVASDVDAIARFANKEAHVAVPFDMTNTKSVRLFISEPDVVPPSGAKRVAISKVYGVFGRMKEMVSDDRSAFCTISHDNTNKFRIVSTYPRQDVIDVTIIGTTHVRVRFTRPVKNVSVTLAGNTVLYDVSVGITTSPNREALLYFVDKASGTGVDPNVVSGTFFVQLTAL